MKHPTSNISQVLRLAVPSIIANVTTPLLSLVDTAIAGHLGAPEYMAAIAVGASLFNMIYFLFAFLRMGISGRSAVAFGSGNRSEGNKILARGFITALCFAGLIILLRHTILSIGFRILEPDALTRAIASPYFLILVFGAPAVLMNYSITGWLIGNQRSRDTMTVSLTVNIVNILMSFIFAIMLKMNVTGIALGTLTAQYAGLITGLYFVRRQGFSLPQRKGFFAPYAAEGKGKSVNIDIFLRTLCLVAVTVWFTRTGARQGAVMLAVNSLLMQFFIIFSYFMDGFAFAGEALVGKYLGAGDRANLRATVASLIKTGVAMAAIFTGGYLLLGDATLRILSDQSEVIDAASEFRLWTLALPVAGFAAFIMDGVFVGLTRTRFMLLSLIIGAGVFFVTLLPLYPHMGNHALWLSFILYLLARGITLMIAYTRILTKKI